MSSDANVTGSSAFVLDAQAAIAPDPDAPGQTTGAGGPRGWPLLVVIALGWLLPATSARRSRGVSLFAAWFSHLALAGAAFAFAMFISAFSAAGLSFTAAVGLWLNALPRLYDAWDGFPNVILPFLGFFLLIEAGFFALAVACIAWGAKDEPLRDSLRNALRQVWLRTAHFLPAILITGCVTVGLDYLDKSWQSIHAGPPLVWPQYPAYPNIPQTDPTYNKAMADYQTALDKWRLEHEATRRVWSAWYASKPWYLREYEAFCIFVGVLSGIWILWALLRAVGTDRPFRSGTHPPLCLYCGYNLTTMPLAARCPECGQAVEASLAGDAQPGAAWEQRREMGLMPAWRLTIGQAIRSIAAFARALPIKAAPTDHRVFLACHVPLTILIGAAGAAGGIVAASGLDDLTSSPMVTLCAPLAFGLLCVAGTGAMILVGSLLVGMTLSWRSGRNLLPASTQIACYLAPILLFWQALGAAAIITVIILVQSGQFEAIARRLGIFTDLLILFWVGLPNLLMAWWYFRLLYRGTEAARFSNR